MRRVADRVAMLSVVILLLSLIFTTSPASTFAIAATASRALAAGGAGWAHVDHRGEAQYWTQRHGHLTGAALAKAQAQANRLPKADHLPPVTRTGPIPSIPGGPSGPWHPLGPAPISVDEGGGQFTTVSGRVQAIAIDPTTAYPNTTMYLGAAEGGVWKTTDGGAHWLPLTDTQLTMATGAIAIDPNNHTTVYVGTGEPNFSLDSYPGDGVLKSTDGGATWTLEGAATFGTRTSFISRIVVNPRNSNQLFVASSIGLQVSNDGGVSYSKVGGGFPQTYQDGSPVWVDDLGINPTTNPVTLYATVEGYGMYRSTNGGANWANLTNGLNPLNGWYRSALAVAPSSPNVVYVVVTADGVNGDVYLPGSYNGGFFTTDGGNTWHQMTSLNQDFTSDGLGDGYAQGWYDLYLAVDPTNDKTVYGGGIDIARTTDARNSAASWQNITSVYTSDNSFIHPDQHAIAFPHCTTFPCPAYLGNDGGVYFSNSLTASPASVTYTDLNTTGLSISTYTGGDVGPNFVNQHLAIGGTQDNGTMVYTGNQVQPEVWGGDGGFAYIDRGAPHNMFTENTGISLQKSTDGGASWNAAHTGIAGTSLFYMPYALDASNDQHLVAGTTAVYESINGGTSWYQTGQTSTNAVSALAINPGNSAVIYAGDQGGFLFQTTNGGSGSYQGYTNYVYLGGFITSIAFDPSDPTGNTVLVASGSTGYGFPTGHLYQTSIGLHSPPVWTDITSGLPSLPINSVLDYYSGDTRVIVVGTDLGVFFTPNDGYQWYQLNNGLPNAPVVQLAMDNAKTTLVAYTHGRGAWAIDIPETKGGTGDGIGVYRPATHTFYLKNQLTTGPADYTDPLGTGTPTPVSGDWNGDGIATVGLFTNGTWSLPASNAPGAPIAQQFSFGTTGDLPVVGDWLGQGHEGIGIFRPSTGTFYLRESVSAGPPDETLSFGTSGDLPVAGDWTGQGYATIGVYRPSQALFFLSNTRCVVCAASLNYTVAFGVTGDVPFTGDWTHQGKTGLGVFRPSNGLTYARNDATTTGYSDFALVYGIAGDQPISGHWNTTAPTKPGTQAATAPPSVAAKTNPPRTRAR